MPVVANFFQRVPFVRISVSFMTGILCSRCYNLSDFLLSGIVATIVFILLLFWDTTRHTEVKCANILLPVGLIILGMSISKRERIPSLFPEEKSYFFAEVCQSPVEKARSYQSILQLSKPGFERTAKVLAYFSKADFDTTIRLGDQLMILARPQLISNFGNPFEFDYQSMMNRKGLFQSVYVGSGSYLKTGVQTHRIRYIPERLREKLMARLRNSPVKNQNLAVVEALALGYRAELDQETIDYFSSTGAMHVLAVSGLHVGLIYYILGFLFSGLKRVKAGKLLLPLSIIAFLWSYAFLTGFSPSVQRATIMFTFIVAGESIRRPVNIYNSLAASAFLLMLINPEVIFEVGFQLSYLAVFGIVLIQPPLSGLLEIRNKFLKGCWNLFSVSVAAQIATFPLGLLYFNQFANYFWLSNFVVIPAATGLIWLIFGFFLFSAVPFLANAIGYLINWVSSVMLYLLKEISELPHALSEGIIIDRLEVILIYLIIVSLIVFGFSKQKSWLIASLSLVIALQSALLLEKYRLLNQQNIILYNSRETLLHLINGRNNYVIFTKTETITPRDAKMIDRVKSHLKLAKPEFIEFTESAYSSKPDLFIGNSRIIFLNAEISFSSARNARSPVIQITRKVKNDPISTYLISNGIGSRENIFYTGINGAFRLDKTGKESAKIAAAGSTR